jgi:hypothetical protein
MSSPALQPILGWVRCTKHQTLILSGKACPVCVEEATQADRTGKPCTLPPLRGERLEDTEGHAV